MNKVYQPFENLYQFTKQSDVRLYEIFRKIDILFRNLYGVVWSDGVTEGSYFKAIAFAGTIDKPVGSTDQYGNFNIDGATITIKRSIVAGSTLITIKYILDPLTGFEITNQTTSSVANYSNSVMTEVGLTSMVHVGTIQTTGGYWPGEFNLYYTDTSISASSLAQLHGSVSATESKLLFADHTGTTKHLIRAGDAAGGGSFGDFSSLKVSGTERIFSAGVADLTSIKVGGTEIVNSSRVADVVSLKIGGTERIDSTGNVKSANGVTGTVPLAKLTAGGTNGSLIFLNGICITIVDPT